VLRTSRAENSSAATPKTESKSPEQPSPANTSSSEAGLDPALFGKHPNDPKLDSVNLNGGKPDSVKPNAAQVDPARLFVRAPSVVEVNLRGELADGCEFVTTAMLHGETGAEGSVQMQVLTAKPTSLGLTASAPTEQGGKSTWSDGERPVMSDTPIL